MHFLSIRKFLQLSLFSIIYASRSSGSSHFCKIQKCVVTAADTYKITLHTFTGIQQENNSKIQKYHLSLTPNIALQSKKLQTNRNGSHPSCLPADSNKDAKEKAHTLVQARTTCSNPAVASRAQAKSGTRMALSAATTARLHRRLHHTDARVPVQQSLLRRPRRSPHPSQASSPRALPRPP
jgi:hypothetical protein